MARAFGRSAMRQLAAAFIDIGWEATANIPGDAVEAWKSTGPGIEHLVTFTVIYNKSDAICFQPSLGVRIHAVNDILSELRGGDATQCLTAYALVNHVSPRSAKHQGRCFLPGSDAELSQAARLTVHEILAISEVQEFFSSMADVYSYIEAIESARWPILSVRDPYIAALISVGRIADAVRAAEQEEREYFEAIAARGIPAYESDLAFVRKIQKLAH